ncbi:MAG: hypothetical protein OHK0013_42990 [Sandaracinaceae bacterium]
MQAASKGAEQVERAIDEGLRAAGMDPSQREMVRRHLDSPPDPTSCCGNACDPCVLTLARAVRTARRVLDLPDDIAG